MRKRRYFKFIGTIKKRFNTLLLLLILMIMFGEYSQRDNYGVWGTDWHIEVISPIIYYVTGIVAIIIIVLIIATGICLFIRYLREKIDEVDKKTLD